MGCNNCLSNLKEEEIISEYNSGNNSPKRKNNKNNALIKKSITLSPKRNTMEENDKFFSSLSSSKNNQKSDLFCLEILDEINKYRIRHGVDELTFDKMEKKMQLFSDATDTVQENIMQSTEDKKAVSKYTQVEVEILMAEYTMVTYPSENGQETKVYYTYYSYHGIYCKKEGENGFEWEIQYEDESQYNKVMDFMKNFDGQEDLFFASSQKFWEDFLDDKIDIDSFLDFWKNRMLSGIQMYFPFLDENEKMEDYFQYVEERYGNTVQKSV